jgi:hypothetical protein
MRAYLSLFVVLLVAACGNSGNSPTADAAAHADSAASGPDAHPGFTLTVSNLQDWCNISEDGGTTFVHDPAPTKYDVGTVVHLQAQPESGTFIFGYWEGILLDDGGSRDTSDTATVTMDADKTVKVCCPFAPPNTVDCVGS